MVSNRYYGQKTIGLFINPTAGKGRALRVAKLVEQRLRAEGIAFVSYQHWPVALPEVHEAWIIGGDGTLNYFINAYPHTQIPLVIFKGGTGNDFAWKLYGDCTGAQQLDKVLAATVRPLDAGVCNGKLYLNSTGIGFDGEVLHSMRTVRLLGGHWGYLMVVVKKIFTFKEHRFAIRAEGLALDDRFLLVAINNSSRTGGGFLVSPQASVADGLLDLVLCKKLGIIKRLRALPLIEKGKHLGRPYVVYQQHTAVTVTCDKELYAQLDGELIKAKEFAISVLRNRFLFRY